MVKSAAKTTLYRLIEAGHLARQKMLVPLHERGLEAGDDALLFGLSDPKGATEEDLLQLTGLSPLALEMRLVRLEQSDVIERLAVGPDLSQGVRLTDKGREIASILEANWQLLEDALIGELDQKNHKGLRKILKRFVKLLSF